MQFDNLYNLAIRDNKGIQNVKPSLGASNQTLSFNQDDLLKQGTQKNSKFTLKYRKLRRLFMRSLNWNGYNFNPDLW